MEDKESIFSDLEPTAVEGSYFQRIVTSMIDWVIEILLIILIYFLLPEEIIPNLLRTKSYSTYIIIFALMIFYRLICLLLFNRTIGMMICRIKYLNSSLQPLSVKEKLIAVFAIRTSNIKYYKAD